MITDTFYSLHTGPQVLLVFFFLFLFCVCCCCCFLALSKNTYDIFQKKVKKPKSTKYVHELVTTGASASQKVVTLTLDLPQKPPESVNISPSVSSSKLIVQSKSSSQLQGVWNDRFIPVSTPEKRGM